MIIISRNGIVKSPGGPLKICMQLGADMKRPEEGSCYPSLFITKQVQGISTKGIFVGV